MTPPYKFSTAEADSFYAPALGSNKAAARYAKYSAKHIHPCPRFSLYLHSGGSNSTSAMAAQTGTSWLRNCAPTGSLWRYIRLEIGSASVRFRIALFKSWMGSESGG